jgi:hypothetical protein
MDDSGAGKVPDQPEDRITLALPAHFRYLRQIALPARSRSWGDTSLESCAVEE